MNDTTQLLLGLHRHPAISPSLMRRLLLAVDNPLQLLSLSPVAVAALGLTPALQQLLIHPEQLLSPDIVADQALLQAQQITLIPIGSDHYPCLLAEIADPPPLLYARGNLDLLRRPQLAMVGSRRPTAGGKDNARRFASTFASAGFTITSGMALGIDAECHAATLAAGGATIAVLGTGVDVIYPKAHRRLYQQIREEGLLLSELPLGSPPLRAHFPSRNRIISGLSLGVVVVEAALRSGSLITARCALEHGREVYAIPGSIHNPASRGCHALIRQGATLVECTDDVMTELQGWLPAASADLPGLEPEPPPLDPQQQSLLDQLGYELTPLELLHQRSGWSVPDLMATLAGLEMIGLVEEIGGSYQRCG